MQSFSYLFLLSFLLFLPLLFTFLYLFSVFISPTARCSGPAEWYPLPAFLLLGVLGTLLNAVQNSAHSLRKQTYERKRIRWQLGDNPYVTPEAFRPLLQKVSQFSYFHLCLENWVILPDRLLTLSTIENHRSVPQFQNAHRVSTP